MDTALGEYLRYNRYLMCIIGQWPYQSFVKKILVCLVFVPNIGVQLVLQGGGLIYALDHIDALMEGVSPCIVSLACIVKYVNHIYNYDQMKELFHIMEEDWDFYKTSKREREIFSHYYEVASKATFGYAASLCGSMAPFMLLPTAVNLASNLGLINVTNDKPHVFRVEYFVDEETYYYPLLIHGYFGTLGYIMIVAALDGMVVFYVQHSSALCEILGEKMQAIVDDDDLDINFYPSVEEDEARRKTKSCIMLHNHIIDYIIISIHFSSARSIASKLDKANRLSYVFQLGLTMIGMTFTGFQAVMTLSQPAISMRYACFTICSTFVLFLESWPGQQLADHTDRLTEYIGKVKWYQTSGSVRKDVCIMMMRSLIPIKLTAGKVYVLNMQNFSAVVRTSLSYFTVLRSVQ